MFEVGWIGLGRMGGNMVRRMLKAGSVRAVVWDRAREPVKEMESFGAVAADSIEDVVAKLRAKPRVVWLMLPAAAVDSMLQELLAHLQTGDVVVDGGNSHYVDDIRRASDLESRGIHYLDVGVSGGVWGIERGYCLMIGGTSAEVARLEPIFNTLAPGSDAASRTPGRDTPNTTAEQGYLHCGPRRRWAFREDGPQRD